jgi:hypothetical protein
VERQNFKKLHKEYVEWFGGTPTAKFNTFRKVWYTTMKGTIVDPDSHEVFKIRRRKRHAVGFTKCNVCAQLEFAILMAKTQLKRATANQKMENHRVKVKADRATLQAYRTVCDGIFKVGVSMDAMDSNKCPCPTHKSKAKQLAGLKVIKNKITGVEMLGGTRRLWLFRTLPNITTGANLTLTILLRMFSLGVLDRAKEFVVNWDGASDNINKTAIKVLTWFLLSAEKEGWPLRKIILLRLKVNQP